MATEEKKLLGHGDADDVFANLFCGLTRERERGGSGREGPKKRLEREWMTERESQSERGECRQRRREKFLGFLYLSY